MKFNKTLLITSLTAILASPSLLAGDDVSEGTTPDATSGASVGDTQTLTITVPEVSLIDVTDDLSVTLIAPVEAGDNFIDTAPLTGATYDISANVAATTPGTKKIIATPGTGANGIPAGWKLKITMAAPATVGSSEGEQTFISATTAQDMVTGITNVAESGLGMTITVGPESTAIMPSFENNRAVTMVYTITAG